MPSPGEDDPANADDSHSPADEPTDSDSAAEESEETQTPGELLPEDSDDAMPENRREPAPERRPRRAASERRGNSGTTREEWRSEPRRPSPPPEGTDDSPGELKLFAYDVVSSVLAVAVIGAYLFAVSGVWPPLVAVESGSMEPNMQVNDLVFVMEEERFPGSGAHPSGIVTARAGEKTGYQQFDDYGDVIVYHPDGDEQTTPIIHRAMFWVEEGDNWCREANPAYLGGVDPGSDQCIADHSGFITKGDNNRRKTETVFKEDYKGKSWEILKLSQLKQIKSLLCD